LELKASVPIVAAAAANGSSANTRRRGTGVLFQCV
jgi:hypothetical protein